MVLATAGTAIEAAFAGKKTIKLGVEDVDYPVAVLIERLHLAVFVGEAERKAS